MQEHPLLDNGTNPIEFTAENDFLLVWMKNEKTTTCYGCCGKFRKLPSDPPPASPYDIVLKGKDQRMYTSNGGGLNFTIDKQNTFYHLKKSCI